MSYPSGGGNNTKRVLLVIGAVVAVVAVIGGIIFAVHSTSDRGLTDASAKSAIQGYLNALLQQDKQTVARHALCGLYDGVMTTPPITPWRIWPVMRSVSSSARQM